MQFSAPATDAARETRFVEMVFPGLSNHYGTLFGGDALKLMGKAAFVAAARHARCNVVMATSDKIEFHQPIPVGDLIEIVARVAREGRSSMTVAVEMVRENLATGERDVVTCGNFEMVAVNAQGRPVAIAHTTQPNLKHLLT